MTRSAQCDRTERRVDGQCAIGYRRADRHGLVSWKDSALPHHHPTSADAWPRIGRWVHREKGVTTYVMTPRTPWLKEISALNVMANFFLYPQG